MLNVKDLSKRFTVHTLGGKEILGFSPLSFTVESGTSLALSGPSGSGKSSVLKCIYRTYLPSSGSVRYRAEAGEEIDLAAAAEIDLVRLREREVGYVTQFLRVLPRVAAADIVAEPLIRRGTDPSAAREEAVALLRRLKIPEDLLDAYPVTFSGGEQQRVNIARAVISAPRLLLLDEPTASLDPGSVEIVLEILNALKAGGTAMVMIFHDHEIMHRMADQIVTMETTRKEEPCYVGG